MDCEKFDRVVLDLLYEELDELTSAAARRHLEHCSRCRGICSGLRATRQIGCLPLVEAPDGLEAKILAAERNARAQLPLRQRLGRSISVLAGYAMRPQLAMAALFLLMIGSSLVLLRVKPGARESLRVTERGVPEREQEAVAVVPVPERARAGEPRTETAAGPAPAALDREPRKERAVGPSAADEEKAGFAPPPMAAPATGLKRESDLGEATGEGATGDDLYDQAMSDYRAGRFGAAQKNFDSVASRGGGNAASAKLYAAQSVANESGCRAATARFEAIGAQHKGSGVGNEATWRAANCYRSLGQTENARRAYQQLVGIPGYGERAERALESLDEERVANGGKAPASLAPAKPKAASGAKAPQSQNKNESPNQDPKSQ